MADPDHAALRFYRLQSHSEAEVFLHVLPPHAATRELPPRAEL